MVLNMSQAIFYSLVLVSEIVWPCAYCKVLLPASFSPCKLNTDCMDVCVANDLHSSYNCINKICLCSSKYHDKDDINPFCFPSKASNSISEKCVEDCDSLKQNMHLHIIQSHVCISDLNQENYVYRCTCFTTKYYNGNIYDIY